MQVSQMISCEWGCLSETTEIFSSLLGFAYVRKHYDRTFTENIHAMVQQIRSTVTLFTHWIDWLDDEFRFDAQLKVINTSC